MTPHHDPSIPHLASESINLIALQLDEDVYGANGDLDDQQIKDRLIEAIHDLTGDLYVENGMIPVSTVASLIRSVWEHKDRMYMEEMARAINAAKALAR